MSMIDGAGFTAAYLTAGYAMWELSHPRPGQVARSSCCSFSPPFYLVPVDDARTQRRRWCRKLSGSAWYRNSCPLIRYLL